MEKKEEKGVHPVNTVHPVTVACRQPLNLIPKCRKLFSCFQFYGSLNLMSIVPSLTVFEKDMMEKEEEDSFYPARPFSFWLLFSEA